MDEYSRTSVPNIFAIGDVTNRCPLLCGADLLVTFCWHTPGNTNRMVEKKEHALPERRLALTPVAIMEGMAFAATAFGNKPTPPDYGKVLAPAGSHGVAAWCGLPDCGTHGVAWQPLQDQQPPQPASVANIEVSDSDLCVVELMAVR